MPPNAKLISDIEALAAAKSYDEEQPHPLVQLDLLGRGEAAHYQLDDPVLAMFRHLTNVRCGTCRSQVISQSTYSDFYSSGSSDRRCGAILQIGALKKDTP